MAFIVKIVSLRATNSLITMIPHINMTRVMRTKNRQTVLRLNELTNNEITNLAEKVMLHQEY